MSVYLECDICRKRLKIPEHIIGRSIKCPLCEAVFKATEERIVSRKSSRAADDDEPPRRKDKDYLDDEDEPVPVKRKAAVRDDDDEDAPPRRKKAAVVDEDDDEPRPAKKKRPAADEDEEIDEAPKPKRRTSVFVLLLLMLLSLTGVGIAFLWTLGFGQARLSGWDFVNISAEKDIPFEDKQQIGIIIAASVTVLCLVFSLIPIRTWLRLVLVLFFLILGYGGSIAVVHWWNDLPFKSEQQKPSEAPPGTPSLNPGGPGGAGGAGRGMLGGGGPGRGKGPDGP